MIFQVEANCSTGKLSIQHDQRQESISTALSFTNDGKLNSGVKTMHLLLILGIALAIGVVGFALQNNVPVTVTFAFWSFDGSLALVLLLAMGLGVLIAGLLSSPSMIKCRWTRSRLSQQVSRLEQEKIASE